MTDELSVPGKPPNMRLVAWMSQNAEDYARQFWGSDPMLGHGDDLQSAIQGFELRSFGGLLPPAAHGILVREVQLQDPNPKPKQAAPVRPVERSGGWVSAREAAAAALEKGQ